MKKVLTGIRDKLVQVKSLVTIQAGSSSVVDDAIVEIDKIFKHVKMLKKRLRVVLDALCLLWVLWKYLSGIGV